MRSFVASDVYLICHRNLCSYGFLYQLPKFQYLRAVHSSDYIIFFYLIIGLLYFFQGAAKVSILMIGHQAIMDAYLCLLHLTAGILVGEHSN